MIWYEKKKRLWFAHISTKEKKSELKTLSHRLWMQKLKIQMPKKSTK